MDKINPNHYKSHPSGVECIEIAQHHDFLIGNAIKYLWRAGLKNEATEVEDLKKAVWYIERKIKVLEKPKPIEITGYPGATVNPESGTINIPCGNTKASPDSGAAHNIGGGGYSFDGKAEEKMTAQCAEAIFEQEINSAKCAFTNIMYGK